MHTARDVIELCESLSIPVYYLPAERLVEPLLDQKILYNAGNVGYGIHVQTRDLVMLDRLTPETHVKVYKK